MEVEGNADGGRLSSPEYDGNLINSYNYEYDMRIYVGSNKQKFNVHIDTGSNILILLSS
jgi:hypothetical protein